MAPCFFSAPIMTLVTMICPRLNLIIELWKMPEPSMKAHDQAESLWWEEVESCARGGAEKFAPKIKSRSKRWTT